MAKLVEIQYNGPELRGAVVALPCVHRQPRTAERVQSVGRRLVHTGRGAFNRNLVVFTVHLARQMLLAPH